MREEASANDMSVASPLLTTGGSTANDLLGNTPAENQKLRRALRDYETKLDKAEALREDLRREVQRLHKQIVGYRQSTQTQSYVKLEKEEKKQKELAVELKHRLGETDAELLRTRASLKERDSLIQQMKDEYNKLFGMLQKHKPGHASPGKLVRSASSTALGAKIAACNNQSRVSESDHPGAATSVMKNRSGQTVNDNPYLIELYKTKIEQLEQEVEGLQVQIRKMIASEYRHKQQNRLFRVEKSQLLDQCDKLRGNLEAAVLSTAKSITNISQEADVPESAPTRVKVNPTTATTARRSSSACALNEVKRLRQRNQFLEDRFRSVLRVAGGPSAKHEERVHPATLSPDAPRTTAAPARLVVDGDEESNEVSMSLSELTRRMSSTEPREVPQAATERSEIMPAPREESFRSIDSTTLESLQNVKRTARVRPQSATSLASRR